jgi:hypothetical protein
MQIQHQARRHRHRHAVQIGKRAEFGQRAVES